MVVFQSGFKVCHSTKSALLKVFNELLLATVSRNSTFLMLLNLTSAFNTIDHRILISRLEHCVIVKGSALEWLRFYLSPSPECCSSSFTRAAQARAQFPHTGLPVCFRIDFKIVLFANKSLNGQAPTYLKLSLWPLTTPRPSMLLRSAAQLFLVVVVVPRSRMEKHKGDHAFAAVGMSGIFGVQTQMSYTCTTTDGTK